MTSAAAPACSVQENGAEFKALQLWLLKKTLSRDDPFMELLLSVDILPCLSFENKEVRRVWMGGWRCVQLCEWVDRDGCVGGWVVCLVGVW